MSEESREITQVYDDYATRHEAAYTVFRRTYELENARPNVETVSRDVVSLIIVLALTTVSIASIVVSGSRTVEEFGGGSIGAVAFVMIEGGIMAYGFFIARRNANKQRLQQTVKWAMAGLVLTVMVGLGANADAVLRGHGITVPKEINIVINLLVALSAPALAFISSDVLAIELMATEIRRREAAIEFSERTREWQKALNTAWSKQQRSWGAKIEISKSVSNTLSNGIPIENVGILPSKSIAGHKKAPDASKRIEQYFQENPMEISNGNALEIAELLGVGKSSVYNYMKVHRGQ